MDQEIHATGNVAEHCAYNAELGHTDVITCDMDTSQGLDALLENASAPKGWVIGPLFQSFKLKMANFTEIVMSPVKLFKANSPPPSTEHPENLSECELPADGPADVGHLEPGGQNDLSDAENAQNTKTMNIKCLKKLSFGEELSTPSLEKSNECAKMCQEPVPLQHSPVLCFPTETVSECVDALLQASVTDFSASHESKLASTVNEDKLKPPPRKRTGILSESNPLASEFKTETSDLEANNCGGVNTTVPLSSSSCNTQPDIECLQLDGDDGIKMENCHSIQQSLHFSSNCVHGRTAKPGKDLEEEEAAYSATGFGRAKGRLKLACHVTGNLCTHDAKKQELMNVASGHDLTKEPPRRAVCTRTAVKTPKATTKRKAHSTRKDEGGQEMLPTVIGAMLKTKTAGSPEAIFVCSLDKSTSVPENLQSVFSSINRSPIVVCQRLNIRADLISRSRPELSIDDGMDLETTVAISSAKEEVEELSLEALVRPDVKPLQVGHRKRNKKPVKRKSAVTEPDLVSASSVEPTDLNVPPPVQRETNLNGSPKRKRRPRAALKSSEAAGGQENKRGVNNIKVTTRKRQAPEGRRTTSKTPVYFEMAPAPSRSQPPSSRPALLSKEVKDVAHEKTAASLVDEVFPTDTDASGLSSKARNHLNIRPRRGDRQRSKARVLHSRTREGAEMLTSASMDDARVATVPRNPPEHGLSRRMLRSYSCPDIPSFGSHEAPPPPSRTPASRHHQSSHTPHVPHPRKSVQRARRHTVCSVEVEREIAPLCLRKEVYPSRRSAPFDCAARHLSPTVALSPSITLSALASCFLSSPLAFLSKKVDSRSSSASPSTSSHVSPPTFSSSKSPGFLHTAGSSYATVDHGSR